MTSMIHQNTLMKGSNRKSMTSLIHQNTLIDFDDTPEYAHEGNGSTSSSPKGNGSTSISPKELSPGSSETSTQSGLEDTTFDIVNIESTLDHNKKSTEDIVNIESTLDDNKKSTEDDYWRKEALKWKKESEEYKQENHKL
eukprot:474008_1